MSRLVFFDPSCPLPYDTRALSARAMPGTEASVIRIADALGAWVVQHNRTTAWERYLPAQRLQGIDHVVVVRDPRALATAQELFPVPDCTCGCTTSCDLVPSAADVCSARRSCCARPTYPSSACHAPTNGMLPERLQWAGSCEPAVAHDLQPGRCGAAARWQPVR